VVYQELRQLLVFERRTVLSVLTVVDNADSDGGSLRVAIATAQSGDTIVFDPSWRMRRSPLASGLYVDRSATADLRTRIAGNQASTSNDDLWGPLPSGP
jgi:hypothetical protein